MRVNRSPSSVSSVSLVPSASLDSSPLPSADSYHHHSHHQGNHSISHDVNDASLLKDVKVDHRRLVSLSHAPSSLQSVDLQSSLKNGSLVPLTEVLVVNEHNQINGKDASRHKQMHGQADQQVDGHISGQHSRNSSTGSYGTPAYRESASSNQVSNATSANGSYASSAASTRPASRVNSAYNSQSISEYSSRATSPSRTSEANGASHVQHVRATITATVASTYDGVTNTVGTIAEESSTLSFNNLKKSDSSDSLEGVVEYQKPSSHHRPRPAHFTFDEQDIMKSFLRAAERDRARAEKEAARLAEQTRRLEEEYELKKRATQQAMQEAREKEELAAYHYHAAQQAYERADQSTVGFDLSTTDDDSFSSAASDDSSQGTKRKFLPVPVHFRFSTNDISRSMAKPSQRQNIGHWTTFPRSSTQMLTPAELRSWITNLIEIQMRQMEKKRAKEMEKVRKQLSAPNSPVGNSQRVANGQVVNGSLTSRIVQQQRGAVNRRSSMPDSIFNSPRDHAANNKPQPPAGAAVAVAGHVQRSSRGVHSRSSTMVSLAEKNAMNSLEASKAKLAFFQQQREREAAAQAAAEKQAQIRRSQSMQAVSHTRHPSDSQLHSRQTFDHRRVQQAATLVSTNSNNQVNANTASALHSSARRSQVLQVNRQATAPATISASNIANTLSSAAVNHHAVPTSANAVVFLTPQPSNARKLLHTTETKVDSRATSPAPVADVSAYSFGPFERSMLDAFGIPVNSLQAQAPQLPQIQQQQQQQQQQQVNVSNGNGHAQRMYKDVPSSGYGQVRASASHPRL